MAKKKIEEAEKVVCKECSYCGEHIYELIVACKHPKHPLFDTKFGVLETEKFCKLYKPIIKKK